MKKFKLLSMALLMSLSIGFITSCSKSGDDDDLQQDQFTLVGKWKEVKEDVYTNGTFTSSTPTTQDNNSCPDYTEFKVDGTFVDIEKDANCNITSTEPGTYSYNAATQTVTTAYANQSSETGQLNDVTPTSFSADFSEVYNGNTYKYRTFYAKIN